MILYVFRLMEKEQDQEFDVFVMQLVLLLLVDRSQSNDQVLVLQNLIV